MPHVGRDEQRRLHTSYLRALDGRGATTMTRFAFRDHQAGERLDATAILERAGKLSPTQRAVLSALVSRARAGTRELPSGTELGDRLGFGRETCRRAVKKLVDAGVIVLEGDPPSCN
jgi:DNA-binding MarR family transcriptional regulator